MLRFITLNAFVSDTGCGTTKVKLNFTAKADGSNLFACDSIIFNCQKAISAQLGGFKLVDSPAQVSKLFAPLWWLLILSAVALINLYSDIVKGVS